MDTIKEISFTHRYWIILLPLILIGADIITGWIQASINGTWGQHQDAQRAVSQERGDNDCCRGFCRAGSNQPACGRDCFYFGLHYCDGNTERLRKLRSSRSAHAHVNNQAA